MSPRKSDRRFNKTPPTPPRALPPQYDPTIFQAAVTAAMTQINARGLMGWVVVPTTLITEKATDTRGSVPIKIS